MTTVSVSVGGWLLVTMDRRAINDANGLWVSPWRVFSITL
jgi:hypothetical protein